MNCLGLDVRVPVGLLFTAIGAALTIFGVFSDPNLYRRSLDINVNLVWGIVLLAFGLLMLRLGWRSRPAGHDIRRGPDRESRVAR